MIVKKFFLSLLSILLLTLEACGQSGALYLPPSTEVESSADAGSATFQKDEAEGEAADSLDSTTSAGEELNEYF